ncbi:hypothetical protein [Ruminococcus bromii]|uniref:hypothetical protein n=1 Tax=Ruminococcus bromii TaxID=40518 RepID=UPI003AB70596
MPKILVNPFSCYKNGCRKRWASQASCPTKLLNISDLQLSYITNVGAGKGLLKVGSSPVPFVNKFPAIPSFTS